MKRSLRESIIEFVFRVWRAQWLMIEKWGWNGWKQFFFFVYFFLLLGLGVVVMNVSILFMNEEEEDEGDEEKENG